MNGPDRIRTAERMIALLRYEADRDGSPAELAQHLWERVLRLYMGITWDEADTAAEAVAVAKSESWGRSMMEAAATMLVEVGAEAELEAFIEAEARSRHLARPAAELAAVIEHARIGGAA